MKKLFFLFTFFLTMNLFGQGFTYSYVDPCSKLTKTIFITNNQNVTVNYLGFISSFSQSDFSNGTFDNWISQIQVQAANQPCDEMKTQTQTTQNSIITQNIISTLTSVTATSTMSVSSVGNSLSNSVDNSSSNNSPSPRRGSSNRQNNGNNQSNNTSSGTVSNGSTTQNGTPNTTGNSGSGSTNGGGNSQNGETSSQNGGNTSGSGVSTQGGSGQTQPSVNNPPSNPQVRVVQTLLKVNLKDKVHLMELQNQMSRVVEMEEQQILLQMPLKLLHLHHQEMVVVPKLESVL